MKIFKHNVLATCIFTCFASTAFTQTTTSGLFATGHTALGFQQPTHYLGWQNGAIPLYFRTGNGTTRNRMLIENNGFGNNSGQIAIGNDLPNNFNPTSRLHLHQNASVLNSVGFTSIKFTDLSTGTTSADGFEVGYSSSGNIPNSTFAQIRNRENTFLKFYTNNQERIHVNANRFVTLDGYASRPTLFTSYASLNSR